MKTALLLHLFYEDQVDFCLRYAQSMPVDSDVIITVCSDQAKALVEKKSLCLAPRKIRILTMPNRGREAGALLVTAAPYLRDYDLVCFAHDKKNLSIKPYTVGISNAYRCFENILGSGAYVQNILSRFANEPRLGMLMPPPPCYADYIYQTGSRWNGNYENTVSLAKEVGIHVELSAKKQLIAPLGAMFWFRPKALAPLLQKEWSYDDFPAEPVPDDGTLPHALECLYGYCAQSQGYYPAQCLTEAYASIELTNRHYVSLVNYRIIGKTMLKRAIKRRVPEPVWLFAKKVYRLFSRRRVPG